MYIFSFLKAKAIPQTLPFPRAGRQFHTQILAPPSILVPNLIPASERLDHDSGAISIGLAQFGIANHVLPIPGRTMLVRIPLLVPKEVPHCKADGSTLVEQNQVEQLVVLGL